MSIRINKNKCVGCKRCLDVCPGSLIKTDATGKAYIKYPKDCWGCTSCLKECKTGAIAFFLGADIGGMGSEMTVNERYDSLEDQKIYRRRTNHRDQQERFKQILDWRTSK